MAEAKKAGTKGARKQASALKKVPTTAQATVKADAVLETPLSPPRAHTAQAEPRAVQPSLPLAEPMQFSRFGQERGDALRQAVSETVAVTARGALEVNEKILDAWQAQSEVALDLWRTAINAPHLPEAIRLQTNGTRHAYEVASAQWKDIAETTARWFNRSLEPLQSMLTERGR